jgi:hypothetical protein
LIAIGIVIKYENMSYKTAVHHAHQVLSLSNKASRYIRDLFDAPDVCSLIFLCASHISQNEVESIRLRTIEYEMIIAQMGNFTIIVTQNPSKIDLKAVVEEKKEGEEKKEVV